MSEPFIRKICIGNVLNFEIFMFFLISSGLIIPPKIINHRIFLQSFNFVCIDIRNFIFCVCEKFSISRLGVHSQIITNDAVMIRSFEHPLWIVVLPIFKIIWICSWSHKWMLCSIKLRSLESTLKIRSLIEIVMRGSM